MTPEERETLLTHWRSRHDAGLDGDTGDVLATIAASVEVVSRSVEDLSDALIGEVMDGGEGIENHPDVMQWLQESALTRETPLSTVLFHLMADHMRLRRDYWDMRGHFQTAMTEVQHVRQQCQRIEQRQYDLEIRPAFQR